MKTGLMRSFLRPLDGSVKRWYSQNLLWSFLK